MGVAAGACAGGWAAGGGAWRAGGGLTLKKLRGCEKYLLVEMTHIVKKTIVQ